MKNKVEKRYLTKFDYKARRLGIAGVIIVVLSLFVLLPISKNISNDNLSLVKEIEEFTHNIEEEENITNSILERK